MKLKSNAILQSHFVIRMIICYRFHEKSMYFIIVPVFRHTIQLKSLNIALNNYFTDYPDSKQYGGIRDGPTDFKSEDIFCYALGPK